MADQEVSGPFSIDREGMKAYLARTDVVYAVLFGSYADGTAEPSSDVDIAVRFPDDMSSVNRFRQRNRIDAELQRYADGFVDVSDIEELPLPVTYAALRDGIILLGDPTIVAAHRERARERYEASAEEREREHEAFIDRLARGDT